MTWARTRAMRRLEVYRPGGGVVDGAGLRPGRRAAAVSGIVARVPAGLCDWGQVDARGPAGREDRGCARQWDWRSASDGVSVFRGAGRAPSGRAWNRNVIRTSTVCPDGSPGPEALSRCRAPAAISMQVQSKSGRSLAAQQGWLRGCSATREGRFRPALAIHGSLADRACLTQR